MKLIHTFAVACLFVLPSAAETQQLFNGRDLTGWEMVGPGRFVVEDGMLKTEGGMGLLWYAGRKIGNETLRVVFKTTGERDNSGVVIRMPDAPPDPWYGVHNGYEVQIDAAGDEWHMTGAIYSLSKASKKAQKGIGEWNTMEIQLEGDLTRVILNGEVVNEFRNDQKVPERKAWYEPVRGPRPTHGYIGLQNHDPRSTVYFREVSVISKPGLPQGDRDRLLSYLHATRKQILDATGDLTPNQLTWKPAQDRWSIAQVLEHLTLTEPMLRKYAEAALARSGPEPEGKRLKTEELVEGMKDRSKPATAPGELQPIGGIPPQFATRTFREQRDQTLEWIRDTKQPLREKFTKWGDGVVDVYQFLYVIPAHSERHLAQINEVKSSADFPQK